MRGTWRAVIRVRSGIAARAACVAAAGFGDAAAAIEPFTEEALARGVVYAMQPWPQQDGHLGFGCGFADLDADGDLDIIILGKAGGSVGLFENDGTGFFTDRSAQSGLPILQEASGLAAADVDDDGLIDIYFTQYGLPNVLARNLGGFRFADIAAAAGVADAGDGQGACFGDFDGNRWLDLYVCNYTHGQGAAPNRLYRNVGGGSFQEVGAAQGVADPGASFEAVWTDFDRDGDLDLYLSNDKGVDPPILPNQLWRNDGGQMVNISAASGAGIGLDSMGLACGDFDGNGWPDFYVTNIPGVGGYNNSLLLNLGNGTFLEFSGPVGVSNPWYSWGAIFFDYDNNGLLDLYVNNMLAPNTLYASDGAFPCPEVAAAAGVTGNSGPSFSSAVGDIDADGDLDLLVNNLGGNVHLFVNHEGDNRNWIRYRVVGLARNGHAIGASADTRIGTQWRFREIMAGGNGYLGQNDITLHVGLAGSLVADEVVVKWPGGTPARTLTGLPANATWTLYPPQRLGDAGGDGAVTLADFFVFAECHDGGFAPGCEMMDFDGDSAIGTDDFDEFLLLYQDPIQDCDGNLQPDLLDLLLERDLDLDGTGIPDACEDAGDVDGDGAVGIIDLLILLGAWGPCPPRPAPCPPDVNADGQVGVVDLLVLLAHWG